MLKKILVLFTLFISQFSLGQDFQWGYEIEGTYTNLENSGIRSIVCDNFGNIYGIGNFSGEMDFDPTNNSYYLESSANNTNNVFIVKLDSNKNLIWAKKFGGLSSHLNHGKSIIIDNEGNLILTGIANGNLIDLNPSSNQDFLINNTGGNTGGYIVKIDSNGNFIYGNFYPDYILKESSVDSSNNIITVGNIGNANSALKKIIILKTNITGNLIWSKQIAGNNIYPHSIKCDNSDNLILTGNFMYSMNIDNTIQNSPYYSDFITKLNSNGDLVWYQRLAKTSSAGLSNKDKAIQIDTNNNIYLCSEFVEDNVINFGNISQSFNSIFGVDCVLFKLNSFGNLIWSKKISGNEQQFSNSIFLDNNSNILISLHNVNNNTLIIDGVPISTFYNSYGTNIIEFDENGSINNLIDRLSYCDRIFKNNTNDLFLGGFFDGNFDFDPSLTSNYYMQTSNATGFILKLGPCDVTQPTTTNNQTFCSSQNPTIANLIPNSTSFNWYIDSINTSELTNSTPLINGHTYYVSRQNGSCPESSRTPVTITINPTPIAPTSSNQTFCENVNASLNNIVITGQNIKWYNSNTILTDIPNSTLLQNNTTYYASQTINGCESNRIPVLITIIPNTLPTITSPQNFCIEQNASLNNIAITGQNIKWYDSPTSGNLLPNTTTLVNGTTYYASQTVTGCESNRVPVLVQIQNTPAPTGSANQSFCSTQNATVSDIITNGTNVIWYPSLTSTTPLANSTVLSNNTTYYATQTINSCESVNRLAVTISLNNTLNATNYSETICDDLNDNIEIKNLANYNSNLITSTGNVFSYYDTYNNALSQNSSGQITNFANYNLTLGTTTFYVRIASPNTCFQIVTLTLELVSKPIIPINNIEPLCEGKNITLNGGNNYDSYTWSTGETSQQITITQPGNYSVVVNENHGTITCSSTKVFTVVNSNIATIQEIISSDWSDNYNTITVVLNNSSQGNYEYSLNGIDFQDSNVFNNLEAGEHTVFVKDKNGCGMISEELFLLMYPKFFTPNGDGYNDFWKIKFSENEPNLTIKIFDRYGKFLKQLGTNSIGWDGKYLGKDVPSSDYWFVVIRENGKEHKGHFSLKR